MMPLIIAVFVASLVGSLHCAGMCGPFVAIAVGEGSRPVLLHTAYHGGRLVSYMLLGVAAGAVGQLANLGGALAGVQPVAAVLAGSALIAFGVVSLLRVLGIKSLALHPPRFLAAVVQRGYRLMADKPPIVRALSIGLLTTLLPCGWLYAFAATAAGTASPWLGALTMAVFWVGTVPVLVAIGSAVRGLTGALGRHISTATALLLIVMGVYSLVGRSMMDPMALVNRVRPISTAEPTRQAVPPCCEKHGDAK